jgi:1,2-diacylglycerol 3-alpha-glucosyltransferase
MKIAMFTDYFFPELGGIQDSIATLSRSLGARGHCVDIYAPRYSPKDYHLAGSAVREPNLGKNVRIHRRRSMPVPSSTGQSRAALPSPKGWPALRRRARPDLIHVHSFFGIGLDALLVGTVLRIPLVGTNHTTVAGFGPHIPISVRRASDYVMWFHNRCEHVTAPSKSVFDELGSARLRRPLSVISNPIDTDRFCPTSANEHDVIKAQLGLTGPVVTYAGRLGPEKNLEPILRAIAMLRDRGLRLQLAIAGHGTHEASLRTLIGDLRIGDQAWLLGTLTQTELADLLRISDIFVMMSTSETQSMALLQAMASGVPVVAANSRALPEFVDGSNGVLVDPHDPAELADTLADLSASPERRRKLGSAGRRKAMRYGAETVADEWEALYRSVLQGSSTT